MTKTTRPAQLIDATEFQARLQCIAQEHAGNATPLRQAIVTELKRRLEHLHAGAEAMLIRDGEGTTCAEALSLAEDALIRELFDLACNHVFPAESVSEQPIAKMRAEKAGAAGNQNGFVIVHVKLNPWYVDC